MPGVCRVLRVTHSHVHLGGASLPPSSSPRRRTIKVCSNVLCEPTLQQHRNTHVTMSNAFYITATHTHERAVMLAAHSGAGPPSPPWRHVHGGIACATFVLAVACLHCRGLVVTGSGSCRACSLFSVQHCSVVLFAFHGGAGPLSQETRHHAQTHALSPCSTTIQSRLPRAGVHLDRSL